MTTTTPNPGTWHMIAFRGHLPDVLALPDSSTLLAALAGFGDVFGFDCIDQVTVESTKTPAGIAADYIALVRAERDRLAAAADVPLHLLDGFAPEDLAELVAPTHPVGAPADWPAFFAAVGDVWHRWTDPTLVHPAARDQLRESWPAFAEALDTLARVVAMDALSRYWRTREAGLTEHPLVTAGAVIEDQGRALAEVGADYWTEHPLHRAAAVVEQWAVGGEGSDRERTVAKLVLHGLGQPYEDAGQLVTAALQTAAGRTGTVQLIEHCARSLGIESEARP